MQSVCVVSDVCLHDVCAWWSVCVLIDVFHCEVCAMWSVCVVSGLCV